MIRLRVSDLDQWVRYVEPDFPEAEVSTEDFLAYMRREEAPNEAMEAGVAFHGLLENATIGDEFDGFEGTQFGEYRFYFDCDLELPLPADREPEIIEREFSTPSGPVLLRGRIDGRDVGRVIWDYKLTSRFDAERYGRLLQWRSYLLMERARCFRYLVFESNRRNNDVWIYAAHPLDFWTYEGMEADVHRRVCELAEFVSRHVPSLVTEGVTV